MKHNNSHTSPLLISLPRILDAQTDHSLWEQTLQLGERQLCSDPVHTLPACSGLPLDDYVPSRVMISTPPFPSPFSGEGVVLALASLSALVTHCFFLQGADSERDVSLPLLIRLRSGHISLHSYFFKTPK